MLKYCTLIVFLPLPKKKSIFGPAEHAVYFKAICDVSLDSEPVAGSVNTV